MPTTWIDPDPIKPSPSLLEFLDDDTFLAKILAKRGYSTPEKAKEFLDPSHYSPTPGKQLPGLKDAASRLINAIKARESILVWGDFDVDGQTATTLLVEALGRLKAETQFHIPNRETEGHGIKIQILKKYLMPTENNSRTSPSPPSPVILLTCDTGISEFEAVSFARSTGTEVIITDHHEPQDKLPDANIILNPHLLGNPSHSLAKLPGVGVVYKLIEEIFSQYNQPEVAKDFLDLVALGIVADVADLTGDTRYLLQIGLKQLQQTKRIGLQMLYELAKIPPEFLDENHIGFSVAPRLNALGRLSDSNIIVEFFTTNDITRAKTIAYQLEGLNNRRKLLTEQVYQGALTQLKQNPDFINSSALVLSETGWPGGVLGLVASRIAELFHKPTILLHIDSDGKAFGSARSIEGIHITQAISKHSEILLNYGGHAQAAGLSILQHNIPDFRAKFSRTVKAMKSKNQWEPSINVDAIISLNSVSIDLLDRIRILSPFGTGNPAPVLASQDLQLVSQKKFGRNQEHLRLIVKDKNDHIQEIIYWRGSGGSLPDEGSIFDLAYHLTTNMYKGERHFQLEWIDFKSRLSKPHSQIETLSTINILDHRKDLSPLSSLNKIKNKGLTQIWAEGPDRKIVGGLDRYQLSPNIDLVIWHAPPSFQVLTETLDRISPINIYLFSLSPSCDSLDEFLTRLIGLTKFAIRKKSGRIEPRALAATMAHTAETVTMGLLLLEAKGHIQYEANENNVLQIQNGSGIKKPELQQLVTELKWMLNEASAFRRYLKTTNPNFISKREKVKSRQSNNLIT